MNKMAYVNQFKVRAKIEFSLGNVADAVYGTYQFRHIPATPLIICIYM